MEKQITSDSISDRREKENLIEKFKIEIGTLSLKQLNEHIQRLNYLALNFDPYSGTDHASVEVMNILVQYRPILLLENPFEFTNALLQILDLTQDELKKRLQ